jgi:putative FmdB family regulatory protein
MPTYQYTCSKCGDDLEVYQSFSDAPLTRHQGCGGSLQKVFAPVGIVLKGSGFYKTDSRSGSRAKADKGERTETKVESGNGAKSESKTDSSSASGAGGSGSSPNGAKKSGADKGSGTSSKPSKQSA